MVQIKKQKEPGETIVETCGCVRSDRVYKWPSSMQLHDDDDDDDDGGGGGGGRGRGGRGGGGGGRGGGRGERYTFLHVK